MRSHDQLLAADWRVAVVWECAIKGRGRQVFVALIDIWPTEFAILGS